MNFQDFFVSNRWAGKLFGAFFGYLIAGSVGALIGILIGNFFDRRVYTFYRNPYWAYFSESDTHIKSTFLKSTFYILGYIAKSDGRVTEQEIKTARTLMDDLKLSEDEKKLARDCFSIGKQSDFNIATVILTLRTVCSNRRNLLRLFIEIQYRAAQQSGMTEKRIEAINQILQLMGMAPLRDQYQYYRDFGYRQQSSHSNQQSSWNNQSGYQQHSQYQNKNASLAQAYNILGLQEGASKQEVKKAYRRLISLNHPDKLIAQGASEAKIKIANDKTQAITKAYEQICTYKGW